jgi:hypothetical protein
MDSSRPAMAIAHRNKDPQERGALTRERTLERLHAEFLEMPGLRLTAAQVQRLCGCSRSFGSTRSGDGTRRNLANSIDCLALFESGHHIEWPLYSTLYSVATPADDRTDHTMSPLSGAFIFTETTWMLWIGIGSVVVLVVLVIVVGNLFRRRRDDVGFVSANWVSQHRGDSQ